MEESAQGESKKQRNEQVAPQSSVKWGAEVGDSAVEVKKVILQKVAREVRAPGEAEGCGYGGFTSRSGDRDGVPES